MRQRQRKTAARALTSTGVRVKLPVEEYWRFRAGVNDVRSIELEATQAAAEFHQRITKASEKARALFAQLANAHGFDPLKTYAWDDATYELIELPPP